MHEVPDIISIEGLSKTEGHASLEIKISNKEVKEVKLMIEENRRFYKKAAVGKNIFVLNQLLSRICGTCSAAHQFATLTALENALGLEVTKEERMLRKLLYYGNMIRDHAMHLYLFTLPDVYRYDSILDFSKENKEIVKEGFRVQEVGANLAALIGGRAIHQINISLTGITKIPSKEELERIKNQLIEIRSYILKLIHIFAKWDMSLLMDYKTQGAMINDDFGFLEGKVIIKNNKILPEEYIVKHVQSIWKDYSHSYFYLYDNEPYMLGALARLNLNKKALNTKTKKDTQKYLNMFPSYNIFHNNLAQAIEILHSIDDSLEIIEQLIQQEFPKPITKTLPQYLGRDIKTYSIIEAPRGLLYYNFHISKEGTIKDAEIITPTAQNAAHIEYHIKKIVEENIDVGKEQLVNIIEMLIRSYDPCFSCASHFLKVRWKKWK